MASEEPKLTGLSKYFNSVTDRGRANVAISALTGMAIAGLYFWLKPKAKKEAKWDKGDIQ